MRIKKAPCLAWVRDAYFPENIGKVVEVISRAPDYEGLPYWHIQLREPTRNIILGSTKESFPVKEMVCRDACLTPINDPDLPVEDVDTVAPKEKEKDVSKFDYELRKENV